MVEYENMPCEHCRARRAKCSLTTAQDPTPPCQRCVDQGRRCVPRFSNEGLTKGISPPQDDIARDAAKAGQDVEQSATNVLARASDAQVSAQSSAPLTQNALSWGSPFTAPQSSAPWSSDVALDPNLDDSIPPRPAMSVITQVTPRESPDPDETLSETSENEVLALPSGVSAGKQGSDAVARPASRGMPIGPCHKSQIAIGSSKKQSVKSGSGSAKIAGTQKQGVGTARTVFTDHPGLPIAPDNKIPVNREQRICIDVEPVNQGSSIKRRRSRRAESTTESKDEAGGSKARHVSLGMGPPAKGKFYPQRESSSGVRTWINENITPALLDCMKQVSESRPEKPLMSLAHLLRQEGERREGQ